MKTNIVVLDLDTYQDLINFKKKIEQGKILSISCFSFGNPRQFYTTDEIFDLIKKENSNLIDLLSGKQELIDKLEKFTVWQFYKWKQSLKNH